MQEYKLTKVYKTDKDKNGNQLINKNGKPYTRMSVKVAEHGEKWISGFESPVNKGWKEGGVVAMVIKENVDKFLWSEVHCYSSKFRVS